jgi:hypothetical protein
MGIFGKKKQDTTVERKQNPQAVIMFMSAIEKGIVGKVQRLIEKEHVTSKTAILEQCAGTNAPWRTNKITTLMISRLGVSIELVELKVREAVNAEMAKYKGLKD